MYKEHYESPDIKLPIYSTHDGDYVAGVKVQAQSRDGVSAVPEFWPMATAFQCEVSPAGQQLNMSFLCKHTITWKPISLMG